MQSSVNIRIRGFSHSRAFFGEPFWRAPAGGKQEHWKHKEGREFRFGIVHALISLLLAPCAPVRRSKLGKSRRHPCMGDAGCLPEGTTPFPGTSSRIRVRQRLYFIFLQPMFVVALSGSVHSALHLDSPKMCAMDDETVAIMDTFGFGDEDMLLRPCVDCGLITGSFSDFCLAEQRCPTEVWSKNQMTPLCTKCDRKHHMCHFCRKVSWATPPPHR